MAPIQEPWYREGRIMGLDISGYTLFWGRGIDRPRAYVSARNMNMWMLPGFSSRDLVTVLRNYNIGKAERRLVVCSACLTIPRTLPRRRCLRNSWATVRRKVSIYGATPHHRVCGSTNWNDTAGALLEFLHSTNLEILNQGNDPTFCSAGRQEVF